MLVFGYHFFEMLLIGETCYREKSILRHINIWRGILGHSAHNKQGLRIKTKCAWVEGWLESLVDKKGCWGYCEPIKSGWRGLAWVNGHLINEGRHNRPVNYQAKKIRKRKSPSVYSKFFVKRNVCDKFGKWEWLEIRLRGGVKNL